MHNEGNWSLENLSGYDFVVTILYFTFTSLSTVGFGDYYPITNAERLIGSFILLFGVAIFSYTLDNLNNIIQRSMETDYEGEIEHQLG